MLGVTGESLDPVCWNVLTSPWLEVMSRYGEAEVGSPLNALQRAAELRCVAAASPLDLFAALRFLLTLLYWKADAADSVAAVRRSLLDGDVPQPVLDAIAAEAPSFRLFDDKRPFLQDPSASRGKPNWKSAGSFFAECATGINLAHFHHGDDRSMRLCVRCATVGLLRLIPWSQSGGRGLTPSVHGAPPIVAVAAGENLAVTLGLNLLPHSASAGAARWTGHFAPTSKESEIPYLEALTWNPRRVHIPLPETINVCWRCGQRNVAGVGPIVYAKNEETLGRKVKRDTVPFQWQDPAAFYSGEMPHTTIKSGDQSDGRTALNGRDLTRLLQEEGPPRSAVVEANPDHIGWHLIVPCTNPKNNKSFDHRQLVLERLTPQAIRSALPSQTPVSPNSLDGWTEPRSPVSARGAATFIHAAVRLLSPGDWAVLSTAAFRGMHESPAAFDLFSGLLWPLRPSVKGLPTRNTAWLVLKLMATVPVRTRLPQTDAVFCPLRSLPKWQADRTRDRPGVVSRYPVALPRGHRLEAELRRTIERNVRLTAPKPIDWVGLCRRLDQLLD